MWAGLGCWGLAPGWQKLWEEGFRVGLAVFHPSLQPEAQCPCWISNTRTQPACSPSFGRGMCSRKLLCKPQDPASEGLCREVCVGSGGCRAVTSVCPGQLLVRAAVGISRQEVAYMEHHRAPLSVRNIARGG